MAQTQYLYPSSAVDSGAGRFANNPWSPVANVYGPPDGNVVTSTEVGGGDPTNTLITSGYGAFIPSYGVITGIQVDYLRYGTNTQMGGISLNRGAQLAGADDFWPAAAGWYTYGGPNYLWGTTWTPAQINDSAFGVNITAQNTHAGGSASIDAIRVTVYWQPGPTYTPKRYLYKVFDAAGKYLGLLPNVVSEFSFPWEINTAGAHISITVAVTVDTARLPVDSLTDESGNVLTDESGVTLTTDGIAVPLVALGPSGTSTLIRNGNTVQVFEVGYFNPAGKCVFLGEMERFEANFGGSSDTITVLVYGDGQDLDNYLVRANPYTYTLDQQNGSWNAGVTVSQSGAGGPSWNYYGQTWKAGTGVTNLAAINLILSGSANVTLSIYNSINAQPTNLMGQMTRLVNVTAATEISFALPSAISVTAGTTYFFTVSVDAGQSIALGYQNTDVYANGQMFNSNFTGSAGGSYQSVGAADLFFRTYSGTGATVGTFTSQDPTTGMLVPALNDYISRGGIISFNTSDITATGLSLTYQTNTNTIYEFIQAVLTLCPSGFYWYVDPGTDKLIMKPASTTADFTLTKGRHIEDLNLVATIENIKNTTFFTGALVGTTNLYVTASDQTSAASYRTRLNRISDNRVTDTATGRQIASANVAQNKAEQYQTTVKILDTTMDTTLIKPGMMVGFNGFGTFVDNLLLQVVRIDYTPEHVTLTLGANPPRLNIALERVIRGLTALQTVTNPATAS